MLAIDLASACWIHRRARADSAAEGGRYPACDATKVARDVAHCKLDVELWLSRPNPGGGRGWVMTTVRAVASGPPQPTSVPPHLRQLSGGDGGATCVPQAQQLQ